MSQSKPSGLSAAGPVKGVAIPISSVFGGGDLEAFTPPPTTIVVTIAAVTNRVIRFLSSPPYGSFSSLCIHLPHEITDLSPYPPPTELYAMSPEGESQAYCAQY